MSDPDINALLSQLTEHLQVIGLALEGAQAEMDAAVAAEREACARIAEDHTPECDGDGCTFIADAIRARKALESQRQNTATEQETSCPNPTPS